MLDPRACGYIVPPPPSFLFSSFFLAITHSSRHHSHFASSCQFSSLSPHYVGLIFTTLSLHFLLLTSPYFIHHSYTLSSSPYNFLFISLHLPSRSSLYLDFTYHHISYSFTISSRPPSSRHFSLFFFYLFSSSIILFLGYLPSAHLNMMKSESHRPNSSVMSLLLSPDRWD